MLRNLATSLINARDERIVTTLPKAKELRPFVEHAITLSRRARSLTGEGAEVRALHLRRQAAGFFHAGNMAQAASAGKRGQLRPERTAGVAALKRLFGELGERYLDRAGGYTRILKLGHREGDRAELAIIELVDNPREKEALEAAKKRAKGGSTKKKKSTDAKKTSGRVQAGESETSKLEATSGETAADSSSEQESESKSSE
jgi:large subunit ribosomal protein L17